MNTLLSRAWKIILVVVLTSAPLVANAQERRDNDDNVLFRQADNTIEFILDFGSSGPIGGHGVEAGTARGAIEGATLTNFEFRGLSLDNRVGIADIDGDRIIFRKTGTGTFLPPLNDPSSAADFQVYGLTGSNIVLTGTYTVVATTGKYMKRFHLGETFPFSSIATNPSWPPATPPTPGTIVPGTEYVVVYRHP
jgi:hypothetical protein